MKKLIIAALLLSGVAFTSCKGDKKVEKAADAAKETVKEAAKEVAETTKEAAEAVEEKAGEAADAVKQEVANLTDAAKAGKALIEGKGGCVACHKTDAKFVGPAYKEVAQVYADKKGNLVKFLKGNADAIVDPPQFPVMKPNLEITKKMTGDELAAIAAYIRAQK